MMWDACNDKDDKGLVLDIRLWTHGRQEQMENCFLLCRQKVLLVARNVRGFKWRLVGMAFIRLARNSRKG